MEWRLHLIIDNYATHKHPKVKAWLKRLPRFNLHFTPTSSSWINLVERFFRDLSEDVVREGSFTSTVELTDAILHYLADRNLNPTRYQWCAKGADILAKIQRKRQFLLYRALGLTPPQFYHCDLMLDEPGQRLANRHDSPSLRS